MQITYSLFLETKVSAGLYCPFSPSSNEGTVSRALLLYVTTKLKLDEPRPDLY